MMGWRMTPDDVEAVQSLGRRGLNREQIAKTLGMSVHTVVCAEQKSRSRGGDRTGIPVSLGSFGMF